MHKLISCFVTLFFVSLCFSQQKENVIIGKIIKEFEKFEQQEFPADTIVSDHPLGSFTEAALLRRYLFYSRMDSMLQQVSEKTLSAKDLINMELLKYIARREITYYRFKEYMNPVLSDEGFHTSLPRFASRPLTTAKEFNQYLSVLKAFPKYVDEHIALIRRGLAAGISQPLIALQNYENTYNKHIEPGVLKSTFYKPFENKPPTIADDEWQQITAKAKQIVEEDVIGSYKKIKSFFENEYYPGARKTLGASALPEGAAYYAEKVQQFTTTKATPGEVYETGLKEVARIRKEMETVMKEVDFKGTFKEFINYLRTDPRFYVTQPEQLLKEAAFIAKKIDAKLPLLFGKLPRQPYGVVPVPEYLAAVYTSGRYGGADINSKRSGSYYVNTSNLASRTLYTLEALTLHEAVPGHHLQIALAQELNDLPKFRRNLYINAFGEGWGLYAEYLGYELGLYKDPYSHFGSLTYEMWRACRLVIDVGIHNKNWTKEEAVNYLAENTALSLHEVNTEINRYIAWPGQALAYKTGELKIKELRKRAEDKLQDKFDVRSFHDLLLSEGTVTLAILDKMVDRYIAEQMKKEQR